MFAGLINALKLVDKKLERIRVVINARELPSPIAKLLKSAGVTSIIVCDRYGIIYEDRERDMNASSWSWRMTNPAGPSGTLADAVRGADVFIGVSQPAR